MYKPVWDETIAQMSRELTRGEVGMWLKPISYIDSTDGNINIGVPSPFIEDQLKSRGYLEKFEKTIREISGMDIKITMKIIAVNEADKTAPVSVDTKTKEIKSVMEDFKRKKHPDLRADFTFDNFVIGPNNDFATNAAIAISKNPGKAYNPFLIYGGVGLGKTHLLQAIGNEIYNLFPEKKVVYVTAEAFTNEFIEATQYKKTSSFKNKYRNADVLLLDDIHFFQGKEQTQEEIFNTFNALSDAKKQMVFTCDRPPSELKNLTERIRSRFSMGLIVDLQAPKVETRMAILKKKASLSSVHINEEVLSFISEKVTTNVRELESALLKIIAFSQLVNKEVTLEIANTQLAYLTADKRQGNLSVDIIIKTVADYFNINSSDLRGKKRVKNIVLPRQIAMFITNELTELSTSEIGNEFGGKDHTTVLYAIQKVEDNLKTDPTLEPVIQKIKTKIRETTGKN